MIQGTSMDDLKYLSDELKFRKDFELPLREYSVDPFGDFPSGKVIGYQNLNNDNLHLLCFNNEICIFDLCHRVYHQQTSPASSFIAYLYLEEFQGSNGEYFPLHVFFKIDGTILAYRIDLSTLEFSRLFISEGGDFSTLNPQSIAVSSKKEIYVSQVGGTAYAWSHLDPSLPLSIFLPSEVAPSQGAPLKYSTFLLEDSIFFCVYKSIFNGEITAEFSKRCPRTGSFKPMNRVNLKHSDFGNVIIKKLSDQLILCITPDKTWNFTSDLKALERKNKGLPSDAQFFSVNYDRTKNSICLHTSCDVFETKNIDRLPARAPVNWSLEKIHSISRYSGSIVDFSYELRENLHVIIYARGSAILVNSSTLKSSLLKCDYEDKSYFSGQVSSNMGSDLDAVLLCGATGDCYGFFEKRCLQYPTCKQIFPFPKDLRHIPIDNIWSTKNGIFYESLGTIYKIDSYSDNGQEGIWIFKNGEMLKDKDNKIIFIDLAASSFEDISGEDSTSTSRGESADFIAIIYTNNTLDLLETTEQSASRRLLHLQLGEWPNEATLISTCYDYRKNILHIAAFVDYRKIFYYNNRNESLEIPTEQDFQVAELQIIDDCVNLAGDFTDRLASNVLIAATSFDGRIRIYSIPNAKVVLEIRSPQNSKFQMVKLANCIIFCNALEVILLRSYDLVYGNLRLPEIPNKIMRLNNSQICILDKYWNLQFLEIPRIPDNEFVIHKPEYQSQFYNFDTYLPLQMSLVPGHDNIVAMTLKDYANSAGLRLVLFDHVQMRILKNYACNIMASNILLVSHFDHLILSYYEHDHSIVKIFNFNLNLIQTRSFAHRITSLYLPELAIRSIRSSFVPGTSNDILERLYRYFNDPRNVCHRIVYETLARPPSITWSHGKGDEYQATDVDILTDFVESRRQPIAIAPESYKLCLTADNHISIGNFKKRIPYEILGITPVNQFIHNVQNGVCRSSHTRPLFLITCSHNAIYILSAKYKQPNN